MSLAAILPLSFVMIAGPQIVSAFFLATSKDWAMNSLSYLAGAALSIIAVVTLAYVAAKGAKVAAGAKQAGTTGQVRRHLTRRHNGTPTRYPERGGSGEAEHKMTGRADKSALPYRPLPHSGGVTP